MKKIKNKNGFSLLEVVLGLSLIGLASAAIYGNYNSKRIYANVDRQALLLKDISERAVNAFAASATPATVATTPNFIAMKAVPADAYDPDLNVISNVFGGTITLSGTNHLSDPNNFTNPVPVNEAQAGTVIITLNNVPDYACSKLGATPYADSTYSFTVNDVPIKLPGEQPNANQVSLLANNCVMGNNNVMAFSHSLFQPDLLSFRVVGNDTRRAKELPLNIAEIGPSAVGSQTCSGGAMWIPETSSCGCSATSYWNGQSCIAFGSGIGNCQPGFGWNGNSCVPHKKIGEVGSHVQLKNNSFNMPVGTQILNSGMVVENGRRILGINYPEEIITNIQNNSITPIAEFDKHQCPSNTGTPGYLTSPTNYSSDPTEVGYWNGYSCVYCKNGSTWDAALMRCVTTGKSANEVN